MSSHRDKPKADVTRVSFTYMQFVFRQKNFVLFNFLTFLEDNAVCLSNFSRLSGSTNFVRVFLSSANGHSEDETHTGPDEFSFYVTCSEI